MVSCPSQIVVANDGWENEIHMNQGDGTFTKVTSTVVSTSDSSWRTMNLACGDIDGDGKIDLVTTNAGQKSKLFWGDGTGGFTENGFTLDSIALSGPQNFVANTGAPGVLMVALFDYDGDGDLDVWLGMRILRNDGNRAFSEPVNCFEFVSGSNGCLSLIDAARTKCPYTAQNSITWSCSEPTSVSVADYDGAPRGCRWHAAAALLSLPSRA
jgi:hypothetical protein